MERGGTVNTPHIQDQQERDLAATFDHATVARTFGSNLRWWRRHLDMSQGELAKKAGTTIVTVGYLERGVRVPHLDIAIRLAVAVGLDLSAVFGLDRWENTK